MSVLSAVCKIKNPGNIDDTKIVGPTVGIVDDAVIRGEVVRQVELYVRERAFNSAAI